MSRWTEDIEQQLGPLVDIITAALAKDPDVASPQWHALQSWCALRSNQAGTGAGCRMQADHTLLGRLDGLAYDSEAFELRALTAPIGEAMWAGFIKDHGFLLGMEATVIGAVSMVSQMPAQMCDRRLPSTSPPLLLPLNGRCCTSFTQSPDLQADRQLKGGGKVLQENARLRGRARRPPVQVVL